MNVLYKNLESLDVLEQLEDKTYDFIYLDLPYGRSQNHYFEYEFRKNSKETSLVRYISKSRDIPLREVTKEDIEQERKTLVQLGYKNYSDYVSNVMENICRIIRDDGILAFQAPMQDYTRINPKLILDQIFPSITNVIIKNPVRRAQTDKNIDFNSIIYFCTKIQDFKFPILMELPPEHSYKNQDGHGSYLLKPAYIHMRGEMQSHQYKWHDITLPDNQQWRYPVEKMEDLYLDDRIVLSDNKVYIKEYRDEHLVPVSSAWEYNDKTKLRFSYSRYIDSQSIKRMFEMFVNTDSNLLCPYDRDGKFSWMADQASYNWTSICPPGFPTDCELFSDIPEDHYIVITDLQSQNRRPYQGGIITGVNDINELKDMISKVGEIQTLVGADSPEEAIEEIQNLIDATVSESSINDSLPEAQEWVQPYWEKLESESQYFIPTGVALYNLFLEDPDADMAAPMIEYCKALESELFKKLFVGYVINLRDRQVRVQEKFPEAFENEDTVPFAEFLQICLGRKNKNHPQKWKIELGKMSYILTEVLEQNSQEPLFVDFRQYLNRAFEQDFFDSDFSSRLDLITKLRNDCAHPYIIKKDEAAENREKIKNKLMTILQYYKNDKC